MTALLASVMGHCNQALICCVLCVFSISLPWAVLLESMFLTFTKVLFSCISVMQDCTQSMLGSLASVVGHCIQALICCVLCVCSALNCLGLYSYSLITDILLRCFPLTIMLDWQCKVEWLAPIMDRYIQEPICHLLSV